MHPEIGKPISIEAHPGLWVAERRHVEEDGQKDDPIATNMGRCSGVQLVRNPGNDIMSDTLEQTIKRAVAMLKQHNLIPRHGEKAVDSAYWSEVIDPEHKPGHGRQGKVQYKDEAGRAPHIVTFDGDKLKVKQTSMFKIGINNSTQGEIIYVIDRDRNFYVGKKAIGNFHHSSFLAGAPALGAGSMMLAEGFKIIEVNNNSGHYKPGLEQLKLTAVIMKLKGADLNRIPFRYTPPRGAAMIWGTGIAMIQHDIA